MATIDPKYKQGKYIQFRLNNVEVHWAKLYVPDTAFGNNRYTIDMHLDDALAALLKAEGFNVQDKEAKDGTIIKNVFKAKKDALTKAGKIQKAPEVVGPDGRTPFTEDIGNGSICNLILSARAWEISRKWTLACYIEKVQVVKHIPYAKGGFEDVSEAPAF
jgi:hypothetical protein